MQFFQQSIPEVHSREQARPLDIFHRRHGNGCWDFALHVMLHSICRKCSHFRRDELGQGRGVLQHDSKHKEKHVHE